MKRSERALRAVSVVSLVLAVAVASLIGKERPSDYPIGLGADPSAAVALYAYLRHRPQAWWPIGLVAASSEIFARWALGEALYPALAASASTMVHALVAALILRGGPRSARLGLESSLFGWIRFATAIVAGAMSGALVASALEPRFFPITPVGVWSLRWLGDAIGVAAALPLLIAWFPRAVPGAKSSWRRPAALEPGRRVSRLLEAASVIVVWALFVVLVVHHRASGSPVHLLLLVPAFVWTASRFGLAWASVGNLAFVILAQQAHIVRAWSTAEGVSLRLFSLLLVLASVCLAVLLEERERVLRSVAASQSRLLAVLTAIPDIVLRVDERGQVLEILGHDEELGPAPKPPIALRELLPEAAATRVEHEVRALLETRAALGLSTDAAPANERWPRSRGRGFRVAHGSPNHQRWLEARIAPLCPEHPLSNPASVGLEAWPGDRDGTSAEPLSAIVSIRDATDVQLGHQQAVEAEKTRALRQLTGGVAHDFNNLLTAIRGQVDLLREDIVDLEQQASLRDLTQAAERGRELTQRLLAYSERQPLQPRALDLVPFVAQVAERTRLTLGPHLVVPESLRPLAKVVCVDPDRLEKALVGLIENARDASPPGAPIRVRVAPEPAAIDNDDARVFARVIVEDDGEGMTAEVRAQACDPFFTTRGVGRTGLGLSMVRGFARQSGGHLQLESTARKGTRATLLLPLVENPLRPQSLPGELEPKLVVVIAGRDPDVRRLVCRHAARLGYVPAEARTVVQVRALVDSLGTLALVIIEKEMSETPAGRSLLARYTGPTALLEVDRWRSPRETLAERRWTAEPRPADRTSLPFPPHAGDPLVLSVDQLGIDLPSLLPPRPVTPRPHLEDSTEDVSPSARGLLHT